MLLYNVDDSLAVGIYYSGLFDENMNRANCNDMLQWIDFLHYSIHGFQLNICGINSNQRLCVCGQRIYDAIECKMMIEDRMMNILWKNHIL